jgi:hypothetical protein
MLKILRDGGAGAEVVMVFTGAGIKRSASTSPTAAARRPEPTH